MQEQKEFNSNTFVKIVDYIKTLTDRVKALEENQRQESDTIIEESKPHQSEHINELVSALVLAQQDMDVAGKSSSGYNFKYADIEEVIRASRTALTEHGLAVVQRVYTNNKQKDYLYTMLAHTSGQYIETRTRLAPDKEGNQGFGAAITYIRRYAYVSIIGLSSSNEPDVDNHRR